MSPNRSPPFHSEVGFETTLPPLIWYSSVTAPRLRLASTRTGCGSPYETLNRKSDIGLFDFSGSRLDVSR